MNLKTTFTALLMCLSASAMANPIDKAEARLIAQEAVGIQDRATDDVPVAPYYVFSRGAGKGFVIVSGDDSTAPIIGYTERGDFVWSELPEPLRAMLQAWGERIAKVQAAPKPGQAKRSIGDRLLSARQGVEAFKAKWEDVPYLCQTHWSQGAPYNNLCPVNPKNASQRAVTGCVATAAAQILYYFHKDNPDTLLSATPTYADDWGSDYGNYPVTESLPKGTLIEYDQMRLSGSGTSRQNTAVARLMYAIGTYSRLNYGPSTAGQPDEAGKAMSSQFMLDNDYIGKWSYSQQQWETKIYNSLKAGSPMLYGGYNENQGGHAVVLDGYQAKTGLFHFNFGWGGSGDGWYTVDDNTGMNGFNEQQRGCLNFKPRKPNLKATMPKNDLYHRSTSTLKVHVVNDGTLDYSGFYFYYSTNGKLPANATKNDKETVIKAGEEGDVIFTYQPTTAPSNNAVYLFVTDGNKNILDSCQVRIHESVADLELQQIGVDAGLTTREVDGMTFATVNNTTATVSALLANGDEGTHCQPMLNCKLSSYDEATKTWEAVTNVYAINDVFEQGEAHAVTFAFRSLAEGTLYRAHLDRSVARVTTPRDIRFATADTAVYFMVRQPDFKMTVDGRKATATGRWNAGLFATANTDGSVLSYDMTGVEELAETPATANPNAVFYTSYPVAGATNVVYDGTCEQLVVTSGQEFAPATAFSATSATFVVDDLQTATWSDIVVPFGVEIPYGMQARRITAVTSSAVSSENARFTSTPEALIILSAHDGLNELHGKNVSVAADTVLVLADENVAAATVLSPIGARSMLFGFKGSLPYYLPTTESAAYPFQPVVTKYSASGVRAIPVSEAYYPELAQVINEAAQLAEQNPVMAGSDALATFEQAIKQSEDMFTFASAASMSDIRLEAETLRAAIADFLNAVATGIESPAAAAADDSTAPVEYYSPSGIRLPKPERGLVIVKRGNSVKKIMVK